MTEAKPTPGPWEAGTRYRGSYVVWGPDRANEDYFVSIHEGPDAGKNARLTAEAGTVYHETGLTPRQLAEQRAELLEALEPFALIAEHDIGTDESDGDDYRPMQRHNVAPRVTVGHLRRAQAAIARAKGEK